MSDEPMDSERLTYRQMLQFNASESQSDLPCPCCGEVTKCDCYVSCDNCGDWIEKSDAVTADAEKYCGIYGTVPLCNRCA